MIPSCGSSFGSSISMALFCNNNMTIKIASSMIHIDTKRMSNLFLTCLYDVEQVGNEQCWPTIMNSLLVTMQCYLQSGFSHPCQNLFVMKLVALQKSVAGSLQNYLVLNALYWHFFSVSCYRY